MAYSYHRSGDHATTAGDANPTTLCMTRPSRFPPSDFLAVAKTTNAPAGQTQLLEAAQTERQFSKAIEMLRDVAAIPPVLLIDGHNPLALLNDLLSEGIHELSDEECLERAQHAEIILFEIADRMQTALTERKNVKAALTSIMARKQSIVSTTASTPRIGK
jgi:aminoglycoside/choline kinase family phosphotransferase